jgi:hypothetical protein
MLQFDHCLGPLSYDGGARLIVVRSEGELRPFVLKVADGDRPAERLAAELLGYRLAQRLGLPVPAAEPLVIPAQELGDTKAWMAGIRGDLHLAIEYVGGAAGAVIDLPPWWLLRRRCDRAQRIALAIFSAWLDARPSPRCIYFRHPRTAAARLEQTQWSSQKNSESGSSYRLAMAGFAGCLGGGSWKLQPLDADQMVAQSEPAAEASAQLSALSSEEIAFQLESIPPPWLERVSSATLAALPAELMRRAQRLQIAEPTRRGQPRRQL